jgi:hypothetical protein
MSHALYSGATELIWHGPASVEDNRVMCTFLYKVVSDGVTQFKSVRFKKMVGFISKTLIKKWDKIKKNRRSVMFVCR